MEIRKIKRMKPRVALLIDTWFPVHTGEQVYTAQLGQALAKDYGYEVDILTRAIRGKTSASEKEFEKPEALRVKRFGWRSGPGNIFLTLSYMLWVFLYLVWHGKSYHLYHAQNATSAIPMKVAAWVTRVPTMLTVHMHHATGSNWTLRKIVHKVMFLETKYTQEISISESFLKAENINEHVLVIPYGVNAEPFDAVPLRRSLDQFNVLFVGRLDVDKGVDLLLKAVQKVIESNGFIQSNKDFSLHLAGNGPDRKSLENLAAKLGISKYIKFHGIVTGEELIHLYKSCDLFVMPSRLDAFPLSILEAGAARLPILASNTGDLKLMVVENVNGHLFESEDLDELAYYLEYYAGNPHLESLGEASYELIRQEFPWSRTIQKILRVYENLLTQEQKTGLKKHEHFWFWELPGLFLKTPRLKSWKGRGPISFCLTLNFAQSFLPEQLPEENEKSLEFLKRFSEFCAHLEIPSTVFVQEDLLKPSLTEFSALQAEGHELGIAITQNDWLTLPTRRTTLRRIKETLEMHELKSVRFVRPPMELGEQDMDALREADFDSLPPSEDPKLILEWHGALPFGRKAVMNLKQFLEWDNEDLLDAIKRLAAYEKNQELPLFLIFECSSFEFSSREDLPYASGENFTLLAKKFAFLKEHLDLEFRTLSDFCKSCSVS